jgi:hypothetical protein
MSCRVWTGGLPKVIIRSASSLLTSSRHLPLVKVSHLLGTRSFIRRLVIPHFDEAREP